MFVSDDASSAAFRSCCVSASGGVTGSVVVLLFLFYNWSWWLFWAIDEEVALPLLQLLPVPAEQSAAVNRRRCVHAFYSYNRWSRSGRKQRLGRQILCCRDFRFELLASGKPLSSGFAFQIST